MTVIVSKKFTAKTRHCWNCGADMGMIEDRHYDRTDTCGAQGCERALRDQLASERQDRHDEIDRDYYGDHF